jgi:hypothetical protein
MSKKKNIKNTKDMSSPIESTEYLDFITGYTSNGFAYGLTKEEYENDFTHFNIQNKEMEIEIIQNNGVNILEIKSKEIILSEPQDVLDLMGEIWSFNSQMIIISEKNVHPNFFDLKTGFSGEVLQKFTNYKVKLVIIGDFSKYTSKSLHDYIFESNKHGHIIFASSLKDAIERLSKKNILTSEKITKAPKC